MNSLPIDWTTWLPVLILLSSLLPGVAIFFLQARSVSLRISLNLLGALLKLALVIIMIYGVFHGQTFEARWQLAPGLELVLHADALSVLFVALSTVLWLVTTLYAIGYLENEPHASRFFGFFSLCVTATVGLALAGNLLTFVMFYELLTLATYPLVAHKGTPEAIRGARIYLCYTLGGGVMLLAGAVWLHAYAGSIEFSAGGVLAEQGLDPFTLQLIFVCLILGLGVKAALFPLHGWLPQAMVAPAPVSALLHAVAVVKAGAFGIVRVVYDVYGVEYAAQLELLPMLAILAAFTIIYGSVRALEQDHLKKRLAYSTVSQVSYIALGTAILGPLATIGGIVHLVHQGLMKITLFFAAGIYAQTLNIHHVSQMSGVGRQLPLTSLAFSAGALGMIGIPPLAGFVSKWYLGLGGLGAGADWVIVVLISSSLLNAAYFLPILHRIWFAVPEAAPAPGSASAANPTSIPTATQGAAMEIQRHGLLVWPPLITALLAIFAGLLAQAPFSPLQWASLIAQREYAL